MIHAVLIDSRQHEPIRMDIDVTADKFMTDDAVVYRVESGDDAY